MQHEEIHRFLESTRLPCSRMKLSRSGTGLSPLASKLGGTPYFPKGFAAPLDSAGDPMVFLAQINFSEVVGSGLPLPSQGILQFWLSHGVGVHGLSFGNGEKAFQAAFHPAPDPDAQAAFPADERSSDALPFLGEIACSFVPDTCIWNSSEESVPIPPEIDGDLLMDMSDDAAPSVDADGRSLLHRIGGHPFFTQSDVRSYEPSPSGAPEKWLLIWQCDSDDSVGILWGDMGIANAFIREDDLLASPPRFDRILWNWDCY